MDGLFNPSYSGVDSIRQIDCAGGDFNVIELDTDVYNPDGYRENALMLPVVRDAFQRLKQQPITHTIRHLNPQEHLYSFWDFQMLAWQKNWGMLLDTIFISNDLLPRLKSSGIYKEVRGWPKTSDHAPVFLCVRIKRRRTCWVPLLVILSVRFMRGNTSKRKTFPFLQKNPLYG